MGADSCWDGYKAKGTKKKNGKEVPNCVKEEDSIRKQRGGDSPSNKDIIKKGAERENAVAKLMQNPDMQKRMDDAIAKSVQRDKEDRKRRYGG